jgi:hypothetical protein
MPVRTQLGIGMRNDRALAGQRWQKLGRQFVRRWRRFPRQVGLTLQWRRPIAWRRWLREHWLASPGPMPWQLNLGLNMHIHADAGSLRNLRAPSSGGSGRSLLAPLLWKEKPSAGTPLISRHFSLQRFVQSQVIAGLQPAVMIVERNMHSALRPIVRESSKVEYKALPTSMADHSRAAESNLLERRMAPVLEANKTAVTTGRVPEINIAHLADQVMRQLDHRISSWRERRGRA